MSDEAEQLYGREGIEQAAGYRPMSEPPATETGGDAPLDSDNSAVRRLAEDDLSTIERSYVDSDDSGKKRPDRESITAERAAEDLSAIRTAERRERQDRENRDLAEALDYLKTQAEAPAEQQPEQHEQPAQLEQQAQPEIQSEFQPQPEAALPGVDPEIAAALQSPKVRALLEQTR